MNVMQAANTVHVLYRSFVRTEVETGKTFKKRERTETSINVIYITLTSLWGLKQLDKYFCQHYLPT